MPIVIEKKMDHATLPARLRGAFKGEGIYRVELPAGMSLYKVTQGQAATKSSIAVDAAGRVTPWWFSYESESVRSAKHGNVSIRGVADVVERTGRTASGFRDFLRSRGAVCHDWNAMTHLLVIALRRPVVGLMGTCSGQPLFADSVKGQQQQVANISFIGGEQQFFLAGLSPGDVRVLRFGALD